MKRDHTFFERWARKNGMAPVIRITDVPINGEITADILIADSDRLITRGEFPPSTDQHTMFAFYRTGFAIDRPGDRTWLASYNDYPSDAFAAYTPEGRKQARIQEAIDFARKALQQTVEAGLYNGRRDRSLFH